MNTKICAAERIHKPVNNIKLGIYMIKPHPPLVIMAHTKNTTTTAQPIVKKIPRSQFFHLKFSASRVSAIRKAMT